MAWPDRVCSHPEAGRTVNRRIFAWAMVVVLLAGACSGDDPLGEDGGSADGTRQSPTGAVAAVAAPSSIERPVPLFASESPFNTPIPQDPELAPDSDVLVQGLVRQVEEQGITLAIRESAIAVYEVDETTPRFDVPLSIGWGSASVLSGVPIPPYAVADSNNDHEIALFDRSTGCEWDFWQFRPVGGSWVASWGNATRLDGTAIYEDGGAARAGGSALLAGLVWPDELAAGHIDHALVFSYGLTRFGAPVSPAVGTDGWSSAPDAIPEGARLQLDPDFDVDSLRFEFERTIARALQEYGMWLMDSTSAGVGLYAVNPVSFVDEPYEALIPAEAWEGDSWVSVEIPPDRFRVLAHGPDVGDPPTDPIVAEGCGEYLGGWREGAWQVAVDGETLYVAAGAGGLVVADLSDPSNPRRIGGFEDPDDEPVISVAVSDGVAYLGTAGSGVRALDVSDPAHPRTIGRYGVDEEYSIVAMAAAGTVLYAAGDELLHVLDVSDHGLRPVSLVVDEEALSNIRDLSIAGDRLYAADQWYEMVVLDVSDPSHVQPVGSFEAEETGATQTYGEGVAAVGDHVYYTDEDGGVQVLDVADPLAPRLVDWVDLEDFGYGVAAADGLLLVANGADGLQVFDVSDPAHPSQQGEVAIDGYAWDVSVAGGMAYVAARRGGVSIVDLADPSNPVVVSTLRP